MARTPITSLTETLLILRAPTEHESDDLNIRRGYLVLVDSSTGEVAAQIHRDELFDRNGMFFDMGEL